MGSLPDTNMVEAFWMDEITQKRVYIEKRVGDRL